MPHIAESTHWYTLDGQPCYEVAAAKGGMRPTTLRDARKLNLVPSVTAIIRMAAAPGLERWKQQQVLHAALTLPVIAGESEDDYLARIMKDSQEQAKKAAERGTAIHKAIESRDWSESTMLYVMGAHEALEKTFGIDHHWISEQSFSHPMGFGGKADDSNGANILVDYKTKEFTADNLPKTWDEHAMQLAAYRVGLGMPTARCAIAFVSVTIPGLTHICELSQDELKKGWECFEALLKFWQAKNGYRPVFDKVVA